MGKVDNRLNDYEHEPTDEPDQFIKGIGSTGNYRQGVIIWKGTKGTLKYWARFFDVSFQAMKYRTQLYMKGKITLDEVMQRSLKPGTGRRDEKKGRPEPEYLPSGIEKVRSLL